ncbi:hypothetical protein Bca4012_087536 [Brassica carinata]
MKFHITVTKTHKTWLKRRRTMVEMAEKGGRDTEKDTREESIIPHTEARISIFLFTVFPGPSPSSPTNSSASRRVAVVHELKKQDDSASKFLSFFFLSSVGIFIPVVGFLQKTVALREPFLSQG